MTKKNITIAVSVIVIAVFAAVAVTAVLLLGNKGGDNVINHLQSEKYGITLIRKNLVMKSLDAEGYLAVTEDDTEKDFTDKKSDNIFGITDSTIIVPGSMFAVEMEISGKENGGSFAYWLGIQVNGSANELANQLKITVKVDEAPSESFYLSEGLTLGRENNPLSVVNQNKPSSFSVCIDFEENRLVNDNAQSKMVYFDLIVYAVEYTG